MYCAVDGSAKLAARRDQGAVVADDASLSPATQAADDPLPEAISLAQGAADSGLGLKLLGGLAVRVICPDLPPRRRAGQDIDFACLSRGRKDVVAYLERSGCVPDRRFNSLNGDRQMYFNAPSGRPIDVMVDRLTMCHVLDFRSSFTMLPLTLDAIDILLSKLQIVELNEKDARDIMHLLAGAPVSGSQSVGNGGTGESGTGQSGTGQSGTGQSGAGQGGGTGQGGGVRPVLDTDRFARLLAADWGWWRTVTANLAKLPSLATDKPDLVPSAGPQDPLAQAARLLDLAHSVPKSMKWKLRANVGDRIRWYELPEEVGH